MITINEANQMKWAVIYKVLNENNLETVIDAQVYDFIPSKGDVIVVENKIYIVNFVLYDFDMSSIVINLKEHTIIQS